jgi:hypothetical protein
MQNFSNDSEISDSEKVEEIVPKKILQENSIGDIDLTKIYPSRNTFKFDNGI